MYGRHYVGRYIREMLSEKVMCEDRQVEAGGGWHAGKSRKSYSTSAGHI